ncbi:MAG: head-tail connector protein [Oscillospiraceae bacterium]|nr:head-tail connector protein [Oscillospiraceae bacterium]
MKVSEIPLESVKQSLRIDYDYDNEILLEIMDNAKGYLVSQTGLTAEEIDAIPEMVYAFKCLCGSMYNNREMSVENIKPNPTAEGIIAMHRRNYL